MESTGTLRGLSSRQPADRDSPGGHVEPCARRDSGKASTLCLLARQVPTTPPQRRAGQVRRHRPGSGIFRREPRCPRTYLTPVTGIRPSRGTYPPSGRMAAPSWAMLCVPVLSSLVGTLALAPVGCQHVPGRVFCDALPSRTSAGHVRGHGSALLSQPYSRVGPFGRVRGGRQLPCGTVAGWTSDMPSSYNERTLSL